MTRYLFTTVNRFGDPVSFSDIILHTPDIPDEKILEAIFARCNRGSGQTSEAFEKSGVPSLSVGNVVLLVTNKIARHYMCDGCGWSLILHK